MISRNSQSSSHSEQAHPQQQPRNKSSQQLETSSQHAAQQIIIVSVLARDEACHKAPYFSAGVCQILLLLAVRHTFVSAIRARVRDRSYISRFQSWRIMTLSAGLSCIIAGRVTIIWWLKSRQVPTFLEDNSIQEMSPAISPISYLIIIIYTWAAIIIIRLPIFMHLYGIQWCRTGQNAYNIQKYRKHPK